MSWVKTEIMKSAESVYEVQNVEYKREMSKSQSNEILCFNPPQPTAPPQLPSHRVLCLITCHPTISKNWFEAST